MKNIFSKTTENRTQNGVKSYLSPTFVLSPILIFAFLTLGVGQMWGDTKVHVKNNAHIFYDPAGSNWDYTYMYLTIADAWGWRMDAITNTQLRHCVTAEYNNSGIRLFAPKSDWGNSNQQMGGWSNMTNDANCNNITDWYGDNGSGGYYSFDSNNGYIITLNKKGSKSDLAKISPSWIGNAFSALNSTVTLKAKVSTNGGSSYDEANTPGALSASSYKFSAWNTCGTQDASTTGSVSAGSASATFTAGYTANTTMSAAEVTGYDFMGWYEGSTKVLNDRTGTMNPHREVTLYAYYKLKQYSVIFNMMGHGSAITGRTVNHGSTTTKPTDPTETGYIFDGWYTDKDCTVEYNFSSSITSDLELYAKWTEITITELSASPSYGTTGSKTMTVSFKTNVPRNAGYYYRIAEFGGAGTGTTGGGYYLNGKEINSGSAETPITTAEFSNTNFPISGTYTSAVEICIGSIVQKRVTFTYTAGDYCTVSFDMQGRGDAVKPQNILSGNTATVPSPAPTATGYTFGGWYENPECTGSAFNFSTAITVSRTLYAKWTPKTTTVTLDRQNGTGETDKVTATYDAAMPAATMPTRDNYTFNGYFTGTEGSGTKYYNADGTSAKNWDIEDATKTLYAHWTEIKYEVTISVSNPSATTGTINCSAAGWVASNNGTAQIGNATEVSMIAGAPASGYTWGSWVLSGGVELISGNLTDAKIVVKATSAGTATYTYAEDLSTTWYISGDGDGTGKDLTPGSPFSGWGTNGTRMSKKAGYSTVEKYYCTITVSTVATTDEHFPFKVYTSSGEKYYGNNGYWVTKENNHPTLSSESGNNMKFRPYITGDYEFEVDNTGANPVLTVHWPSINQLRVSVASPEDGSNIGNFDLTETSPNNWSVTRTLNANTTYTFKMVFDGAWYGNGTAFTRDNNSAEVLGDGNHMTIQTDVAGEYTFTFNSNNKNLNITFPTAYRVTYGVGTGYTSPGRVSTEPNITSGDYVIAGTNITFTATPNLGYKFVGWYSDDACTRSLSTDNPYTVSVTEEKNVYAKFELMDIKINSDVDGVWPTPWSQYIMDHDPGSPAVYTYSTTLTTRVTEGGAAPFNSGYHFNFLASNNEPLYDYNGVQTPTYSGSSIDGVRKTDDGNPTIQFGLTRKSDVTITLTLLDAAKPTVHIAANPYYDITYKAPSHGTYTIQVGAAEAVSANTEARANTTITLANTPATGYHFGSWTVAKSKGNVEVSNNQFTMPAENVTVSATFTANTYSVQFNGNGATDGSMANQDFTYDAAQNLTANAFTKTGYTFAGWATEAAGAVAYTDGAQVSNLTDVNNGTATLYAKWTPNKYTVTLDKQTSEEGYGGDEGTVANQTVTFDATLTTVSGSMPTAKNGWAFMGFYSAKEGGGRQFINPLGNWVTNAGDTIRDSKWVYDGNVTLYAYYKKAEITDLIFDAAVVAPSASVGVTPKVDPTPEGTNSICWKLLYNNGNLYTPQPNFENPREIANKVTFTAPNTSGMYLVAAVLRTGTDCNGGTKLDSVTYPFQVAGDHTVTVQYKCGDVTLQGSTSVSARPLDWSGDITAPTITGYTFTRWEAGDGITIKDGETNSNPTHIKAIYDGKLTAVYTQKRMIYFNNTLGWSAVYVYFYENNKYWGYEANAGKGTGSNPNWRSQDQSSCPFKHKGAMTQIEGTNIWYYDCEANSINASYTNVAFNEKDQTNYDYFSDTKVVRRGDYHSSLPMFVPLTGVDPVKMNNNKAEYYNEGYWMNYPENTGYSLHIYKGTAKGERDEIRSIAFPFTADKTMPMEVTLELNANTIYGYEIHRADGAYYAYNGTIKINASSDIKLSADQRGGIKTSAAGDYVFKLNFGNSDGYGYLFSVQYPASEGSYRLVYKDLAEWSQGSAHTDAWSHPSRVIYKNEGAADTVSFFIAKGHTPTIQIQKIKSIDNEGNITWENVGSATSYDNVSAAGVYNFITSQTAGALSIDKVEPYTGNYYIRTDNAGSTKWDNYRAADHQMTYSEFSKDRATNTFGELYTHYYMHWCPRGTNVKFCIANDYSSCITDTLVNDVVSLGNMADAGWLNRDNESEVYRDKFSANIRFMYDERTNKISRAYMSSSTNTDRKFLVLKSNTEFKNSDGTVLSGSGESATEGNYEAIFKDNEDWIYEREIKLNPGQKFKLYASYAQETAQENGSQHFCGNYANNDWENAENYVALVGGTGDACNVRIIYDFKTNRLLAAMVPSGEISTGMEIYADVMFIREHQGDIEQLIFNGNGKITNIKTAYGVMRFNKWTLNNREKTGDHIPLVSPASIYERAMYFISFPFEVKLSEVFGFGTYGQDWIIEYYDGAERARTGWWEGQPGFWRYVWDRKNFVLKPNVGYLLELELGNFKEGSGFWNNKNERLELFFPSSGPLGSIMNSTVNCTIPEHTCYINRHETEGLQDSPDPSKSYNRTIFDSHWNIMSVPTYVNVDNPNFANTTWIGDEKGNVGPKFLYTWNMNDNTLTATSGKGFMYHAMHAYTVQYYGDVTWTTSVTPTAAPQRNTEYRGEYEFCLEVQQDDQMIDRTYVRLSDDENVTTGFEFSEDMTKQFNSRKANIFTIAGNTSLGGNSLPLSTTQTTVVPVGVKIKTAGDYTFSIPEGTDGIGVTLVDNETGVRTLLSALDYTVNLAAGDYTERFWLEISPIQNTPTGIEEPTSDSSLKGRAQKRIIDGVLYIVKDGKIFDARGTRVE